MQLLLLTMKDGRGSSLRARLGNTWEENRRGASVDLRGPAQSKCLSSCPSASCAFLGI